MELEYSPKMEARFLAEAIGLDAEQQKRVERALEIAYLEGMQKAVDTMRVIIASDRPDNNTH